ncbi:hypothetical protein H072_4946 [Dactylellina haptotyla CBS 200.50]|uniref:Carboxylic ester hydrolase n=1 Tax=Dactylellina haptotyla (strain CBS 200.50) TaxID=1284197 RepID=S8C0H5_DACHA|nr:hypothetical protein H072_4946 [Dactylellina haptotyla CBS 200.50]
MRVSSIAGALALNLPLVFATPQPSFQSKCEALSTSFHADDAQVLVAAYVTAGTNITFPESAANTCPKFVISLADICRLRMNMTTSPTSSVIVEAFMPVDWSSKGQRSLMTGNGGLGGCIPYGDMVFGTSLGFAAIGHDNGHAGDNGLPFYNKPQVVKDYVWRALYKAGRLGKKAINHFYTGKIQKAYYMGCSSGGRQGLKAAQDFPDEYDGILSIAPAIRYEGLSAANAHYFKIFGVPGDATFLTLEQWQKVHQMVIAQCDGIDGVLDNVLEDPMKCEPRPEALLCGPGESWAANQCLTSAQVGAIREFYQPYYGNKGKLIMPRMNPLTREFLGFRVTYGGVPSYFSEGWYKYALYNDPSWSVAADFNLNTYDYDMKKDLFGVSTYKTDLTDLRNSGTKLLQYHGLSDGLISSENTITYYNDVSRTMGLKSSQLDDFYRFFPVSGLDHCYTGDGAWFVGGPVQYSAPGALSIDPSDGALMTMVNWVEQGIAPVTLMGRKLINGTVMGERAHCKYPAKQTYKGTGDPDVASSWECRS